MSLPFYLVESLGMPRNHHALFVETNEKQGYGHKFHVTGSIANGMAYENIPDWRPEDSPEFVAKHLLGWVSSSDLRLIDDICRSNPPPEKQFDGPKRIDKMKPLRRCQEWSSEVVDLLRKQGVLRMDAGKGV